MKLLALLVTLFLAPICAQDVTTAAMTAVVTDESGKFMPDVMITGFFEWKGDTIQVTQYTNETGRAQVASKTRQTASLLARKDGYYPSGFGSFMFKTLLDGKWQPYNMEAPLILRRIKDPVPLLAVGGLEIAIPTVGAYEFDLEKQDWVEPFGQGKKPDFVFTVVKSGSRSKGDATLKLNFSNPKDGLVPVQNYAPGGSDLRFPRYAPIDGYLPERSWRKSWFLPNPDSLSDSEENRKLRQEMQESLKSSPPPVGYFFRIRTVTDKNGKIVSALYGKIDCGPVVPSLYQGDLAWDAEGGENAAKITLTYYLNPTGSRNLEYKIGANLFKDLKTGYEPRWP